MTTSVGPCRIDLHCHTAGSFDSRADPMAMARAAAAAGITHLVVTDHDTLDAARRLRDDLAAGAVPGLAGLTVIVGCEIHTAAGDLVAAFLERPVPADLPPDETIDAVHAAGGLVGIPHPFDRSRRSILRDPATLERLAGADWVEVHNARVASDADNERAAALARRLGLPGVAVSDAHTTLEAGAAWTTLSTEPATAAALRAALATAIPVVATGHEAGDAGGGPLGRLVARLRRSG